jgi:hypothetical protein
MNIYTHTGVQQLSRRFSGEFVEPNYANEEQEEVVKFAAVMSNVATIAMCEMAGAADRAHAILVKAIELGFGVERS